MPLSFRKREGRQKGFTLLEVLVAMVILSIALFGTARLLGSLIGYNQLADQVTTATTLAQDKIEEFKNTDYWNIEGSSETQSIYSITWVVDTDSPAADTKTLTVRVGWRWRGVDREVVLRTIIGQ